MWAMYVIRATCFPYADLPDPFAPVTIICHQPRKEGTDHAAEITGVPAVQDRVVVDVTCRAVDGVQRMNPLSDPQNGVFPHDRAAEV